MNTVAEQDSDPPNSPAETAAPKDEPPRPTPKPPRRFPVLAGAWAAFALFLAGLVIWAQLAPLEPVTEQGAVPEVVGLDLAQDQNPEPPAEIMLEGPDPALFETTQAGTLPIVSVDGRAARDVYARPYVAGDRPMIAIVFVDLGLADEGTRSAIADMPGEISLAFSPYSLALARWLPLARGGGHESLLMLPMEPNSYPRDDPGPQTLLTALEPAENNDRLDWVLAQGEGYVGVVTQFGSAFMHARAALEPILEQTARRGLLFVDSGSGNIGLLQQMVRPLELPLARADIVIDDRLDGDDIDLRLAQLEELARANGTALGLAHAYPVTLARVAAWLEQLEGRGFALAPVSAIAAQVPPL